MFLSTPAQMNVHTERGSNQSRHTPPSSSPESLPLNEEAVFAAQNAQAKDLFIEKNTRFIIRAIQRITHRRVTPSDEEWSIGLLAFSEAVDRYHPDRGNFASYAYMVIQRRLADHYRATVRTAREIDVSPHVFTGDAEEADGPIAYSVHAASQPAREREGLQEEISAANAQLNAFGFSFFALTACSPQTAKTRKACAAAAACMLKDPSLIAAMNRRRALPAKRIQELTGLPAKLLDRHRKYIIAITLLMQGDYPYLQEYLHLVRKEMRV